MTLTEFVEIAVRERAYEVLARHEQILLSDRDFVLFEELMTRPVEPNDLVRAEVAEFNEKARKSSPFKGEMDERL